MDLSETSPFATESRDPVTACTPPRPLPEESTTAVNLRPMSSEHSDTFIIDPNGNKGRSHTAPVLRPLLSRRRSTQRLAAAPAGERLGAAVPTAQNRPGQTAQVS